MSDDKKPDAAPNRKQLVTKEILRPILIRAARSRRCLSYKEVAIELSQPWTRGFMSSLARALRELGDENRNANEPLLMALVVNSETRLPGAKYFDLVGLQDSDMLRKRHEFKTELDRVKDFNWESS